MNVSEIFANSARLQGQLVEVQGFFVLVGQNAYFIDAIDDRDNRRRALKIDVPDIKKIIMKNAPPSGGIKYYYLDEAIVSGTLNRCAEGDFQYSIVDVTTLEIKKSGEAFVAI